MNDLLSIANYILEGKPFYNKGRRFLNFLFLASITSFTYKWLIGNYEFLDIGNYKGIINFFIEGKFFIPLSIYASLYGVTELIGFLLFSVVTHIKLIKWKRKLMSEEFDDNMFKEGLDLILFMTRYLSVHNLSAKQMIKSYKENVKGVPHTEINELQQEIAKSTDNMKRYFIFCIRAIFAISIFKVTLPEFHWLAYTGVMFILIVCLLGIYILYNLVSLLPAIVRVFCIQAEKYKIDPELIQSNEPIQFGQEHLSLHS
ncbi:hypothetical protein [Mucilaginibacter aquariorum]|uniref:DUF4239 domain-containing protein n=1 Tax=Mucilaginibacter aquariorum TaxID=2967225 RepID=A0ABT1SXZ4_9SPHI|nr:hypothetical protein [Mucilaginibacter aquariorum]MCQ6957088.1 hypothetical protein [Mucilaginibacter aquariorum]